MKTVFLFSGQGSQHFQMGRELFERNECFRAAMQDMDRVLCERYGDSVLATLFAEHHRQELPFANLLHSHPAIFMVEYALAKSLVEAGVRPDLVLGASLGTFVAAAVAGHLEPEAALSAVVEQAIAVDRHCEQGCMIAVIGEPERYLTPELLALCELGASNFATHAVLSLPATHMAAVEAHLRSHHLPFQRLPVEYAFHSRWIDPASQPYQAFLRALRFRKGPVPVVCCATGQLLQDLPADHFWSAVRAPIRFRQAIAQLESHGSYRYIDAGPSGTLATFLKYALPAGSASLVHSLMSPFGSDVERLHALTATARPAMRQTDQTPSPAAPGDESQHVRGRRNMQSDKRQAIIFPGQGSQFKGMGKEVFPLFPDQVASASEILGYSLEALCLDDAQGLLSQTQYTQPALFVVNALHYQRQRELAAAEGAAPPDFFAGHSVGEYNALLAAGAFSFETGVRLVKKRGELMAAAKGGGMAAVVGISAREIKAILDEHGLAQIDVANFNTPTQTVIAGERAALAAAAEIFGQKSVRCVTLNVSAAFHSRHMRAAQAEFAEFLRAFEFAAPTTPVIANVTARPYEADRVAQTLAEQIASPVQWVDSIRYLMGRGELEFKEIGASVLTKMVNEIRAKETPIEDPAPSVTPLHGGHVEHVPHAEHEKTTQELPASPAKAADDSAPAAGAGFPRLQATALGSAVFKRRLGLQYAYMAGAMYRGVASAELVITMGKAGLLSFFGAGGLSLEKIEANIVRIRAELKNGQPYGMNLLANYEYPAAEEAVVGLYLKHGIKNVEAAAFMQMTPALIWFRLQGLHSNARGEVICEHRVIAKVSRPEVALAFMNPPPPAIVEKLLQRQLITPQQAELSQRIPVSHDICVEADSGGHTDGGIAAVMLPPMLHMRDEMQRTHRYAEPLCMGLAGGIGGPEAAAAAFLLGADFVMTGSINQCTVEAGMSPAGKSMLQEIDIQDTEYAPAGDMFEIGAQVQVMKKSVFFPARANKLLSLYRHYESLDDIPERVRRQLEGSFFKKTFEEIWRETAAYFRSTRLEHEVVKAEANPKHKMALVFRWYFAYCTRAAMDGAEDRVNYQIQTGPALGSFNRWVKGTALEPWDKRHVDQIAVKLMEATAEHLTRSFGRFFGDGWPAQASPGKAADEAIDEPIKTAPLPVARAMR